MGTLTQFLKLYKPTTDEISWSAQVDGNFDILDTFVRQFMSIPNFQGAWQNSQGYAVGQVALDTGDGNFYRVLVANTSAALPTTFTQDRAARPTLWVLDNNTVQTSVNAAAASATAAANSAAAATNAANTATTQLHAFQQTYYGAFAADPVADPLGGARTSGDLYFNTTTQRLRVFIPPNWVEITATTGAITDAPINGTTFGRNNATWINVVPLTGGVINGSVGIGTAVPANTGGNTILSNVNTSLNHVTNLYFDASIGNWRYINASATLGNAGASWLMSGVRDIGFGALRGQGLQILIPSDNTFAAGQVVTSFLAPLRLDQTGTMIITGVGLQPGGGVWGAASDARVKTVTGAYSRGLAELLEMLPKTFTYKGNDNYRADDGGVGPPIHPDTTTQYIGLVAQDCEPYMPELVTLASAYIDGVWHDDVKTVNATGVIYALVNAVAELDARLKALEP